MTDPNVPVTYQEPQLPDAKPEQRIDTVWGTIRVISAVPDWTPRGKQDDSMALYVNGTTQRLYFYDFTNNVWRFFTHTTVAANGSSALEGDVIIDATGLTLSQASQTITLATKTPYFGTANGSKSFSSGHDSQDITFNIGFDPKLIMFFGYIDDTSLGSNAISNDFANSNTGMRPSIWLNGSHQIGPTLSAAGSINGDVFDSFMRFTSSFSNNVELKVQSHDATSTVIRFNRISGATDEQLYYQFFFVAFP